ncbi:efflux RND transporter periplasmic adaptor subunit [Thiorhodococcus mannitoliphagus]|uniref:Efflux RND transporter periplasmic adaptor subunit n=1 Tax=Thiorhodococcus mannitoliphagus TaxID=329406 RepID=A0A6P1DLS9_9GAMM|nr:efflux RND transporter periplasmic adaptor subunit [Thiorhodococcus mannitoliphagus]NEX19207.1 efflux RND transporter periplasmic adaptor subunit [Thiorhodococcus mannitoliphagus]
MIADARRPLMAALFPLTAALLLAGCDKPDQAAGPGAGGAPTPEVGTVTVQARATTLTTELPGRTTSYRIAEVRPQVGGIIQERLFKEGGQIAVGQVLYQIDPAVYQATFDSAKAALARSKATLARAQLKADRYAGLVKANAVSQEDYDDAEAALKEAAASVAVDEADLATARINLEYTRVTSPIAGRIGRSTVTQGALVTANQELALATVQQLDPIYVDLTQSSAQLLRLRRALEDGRLQRPDGDQPKVSLRLEDGSRYPLEGRLEFSEVTVDRGTGAVTLRASFPNPDDVLLPGMFVRASVEEGIRPDAILVPQQGVQRDRRGNPIALVLTASGEVEQRTLKTDRAMGNQWLVDSGLAPGDTLIVEGTQKVRAGAKAQGVDVSEKLAEAVASTQP